MVFGDSADKYLKVHSRGSTEADVTEGSGGVWERLHYDCGSRPCGDDDNRLQRVGRQLGPHLHLHTEEAAVVRRSERPEATSLIGFERSRRSAVALSGCAARAGECSCDIGPSPRPWKTGGFHGCEPAARKARSASRARCPRDPEVQELWRRRLRPIARSRSCWCMARLRMVRDGAGGSRGCTV